MGVTLYSQLNHVKMKYINTNVNITETQGIPA